MITLIVQEDVEPKEDNDQWSPCPHRSSGTDGEWYRRHSLERRRRRIGYPVERPARRAGCYEKGHQTPATPKKSILISAGLNAFKTQNAPQKGSEEIAKSFDLLATQWEEETRNLSSPTAKAAHPNYRAIIDMDRPALPLIFQRMKVRPAFWFEALRRITGENPVTPPMRGNVQRMTEAWLSWGEKRGYGASR